MTTEGRFWLLRDTHTAHKQGTKAVARRQRDRLADMVSFSRPRSPTTEGTTGTCPSVSPTLNGSRSQARPN